LEQVLSIIIFLKAILDLNIALSKKFKKLLITGRSGFIVSSVIHHIINNTCDSVVNVDKLTYAGNLKI